MKVLIAFLLLNTFTFGDEKSDDEEPTGKMVYHCDFNDDARYNLMMANIRYSYEYYNNNLQEYDIRVVANAECIRYLLKNKTGNLLAPPKDIKDKIKTRALDHDITFSVCGNSLDALGIKKENLVPYAKLTPSGVVEIARLQQEEGFAYLKAR